MSHTRDLVAQFSDPRGVVLVAADFSYASLAPGIDQVIGFFPQAFVALQTCRAGGASEGSYASFNLGDHVGDDPHAVATNRQRLSAYCPKPIPWLRQVHGVDVASAENAISGDCHADGTSTAEPGQPCLVMTADCLPILVARPATGQCAALHAGWRGLCQGVIEAGLAELAHRPAPAVQADDWYVWIGPAIGLQAFEVGDDVRQAFLAHDRRDAIGFVAAKNSPGKWLANLAGLAVSRIAAWSHAANPRGIVRVAVDADCVVRHADRYYSFRRDGRTGRMASLIYRADSAASGP